MDNDGRRAYTLSSLASLRMLAMLFCIGTAMSGQTASGQSGQDQHTTLPPQYRDDDTTRREIADMDRFLDSHPEIAEQLRKDPSLIDNREWVTNHPALQEYLQNHPKVSEEFKENPNAFMKREDRYERQEDRAGDRDRDRDRGRDNDTTRRDLAEMDRFLDSHPEIAQQLRKDPSLINNREWVANHPALQEYLQKHPEVSEEIKENPNAFMRQENRTDTKTCGRFRVDFVHGRMPDILLSRNHERHSGRFTLDGSFSGEVRCVSQLAGR